MSDVTAAAAITTPAPAATSSSAPPPAVAAPAPAAGTSTASDWTSGYKEENRGYIQNKNFKDPEAVVESYRTLESSFSRLMGAPKERLVKLPERADDKAGWDEVYFKMGRPGTANDYKIPMPENGGDKTFMEAAKGMFHEAGLTQPQAEKLAGKWNEYAQGVVAAQQQAQQTKNTADQTALKKEWGAAFDQNVTIGRRAASTFGLDGPTIDKLEGALGFAGVIKLMHNIGSKLGEDSFVGGNDRRGSGFGGALTPEAARSRINTLKNDPDFVARYARGEAMAKEEMTQLHRYLVAGD